ncbi:hypothetical protein ACH9D2_18875 [Kocuria sp. M4R2S49]|uniref:hypothetical protein n=1 Tax=Kocuria rhizosphaericola TaxID=3376284 RepID=UPI00378A4CE6
MLSVPGVRDARFNNATDVWPEGVPRDKQRSRQEYGVALLGTNAADALGAAVTLTLTDDPRTNLHGRLNPVRNQQARDRRADRQGLRSGRLPAGLAEPPPERRVHRPRPRRDPPRC